MRQGRYAAAEPSIVRRKRKFEDRMPKTGLDRDCREWSRYHRPDNHGQLANSARAAASV
jgi:hypothetical protein